VWGVDENEFGFFGNQFFLTCPQGMEKSCGLSSTNLGTPLQRRYGGQIAIIDRLYENSFLIRIEQSHNSCKKIAWVAPAVMVISVAGLQVKW
jgi:hypothetical protein